MPQQSTNSLIRAKVLALAEKCGYQDVDILDEDILPETGYLDSQSIIELVIWIEGEFGIVIDDNEVTIDNLGSIARICAFVSR